MIKLNSFNTVTGEQKQFFIICSDCNNNNKVATTFITTSLAGIR